MLFWSIGKFRVVELGYMTPRGSLENLGPKQKGKESPSWGHPCGLQGFVLCGCAVWAQGFIHSRSAAQPLFLFLSASWTDTSKKRVIAHMGIYCSKGGSSFPRPPYSGLAEPTQDPGFPTESSVCVWIMNGNSGCSVVLLLISVAVAEAKLQLAKGESARDWPCPLFSLHVATELEQGNNKGLLLWEGEKHGLGLT